MNAKINQIGASLIRTNRSNIRVTSLMRQSNTRITSGKHNCTQKRCLSSKKKKKPKLSTPGAGSVEAMWCTSTQAPTNKRPLEMGKYGLKRLDYSNMKPPVWTTPPHPPTKTLAERLVFPLSIAVVAGIILWVYTSPEEEDMTEYWKRVESGRILMDDDDDDDDEEDDDDE